ncbi:hypothetical protein C8R43DRAFT_888085 [Mycena crocata]|nr:hypothetical protein C8R43DRAFT_888085 [Mycena crocata]
MIYSALLILPFVAVARASNDWSKPCTSGVCFWDIPATQGAASGTVKIWGPETAIGDITGAAGWEILGCDPAALSQDIRLVCTGDKDQCQHLYGGHGAVDTLVRLPAECGKGPFARVANAWVPEDQSLPDHIAARFVRRGEPSPEVKALALDTNFAAADSSKTGVVQIAIKGANVPGVQDIAAADTATDGPQRRSRLNRRFGLGSFVKNAAKSIADGVEKGVDAVKDGVEAVGDAAGDANTVDIDQSKALKPIDFSKSKNLFSKSLSCPPIDAKVSVDVNANAHAVVTIGVAATGTIVPPKIDDFQIVASMTADLTGDVTLVADLSGSLASPNLKLFEIGIPGLDFPGILSIGPTFEVNANAKATLDLNVDMTVGINYHVENAQLFFPPKDEKSGGAFSLGDTPLKLSADTKASAVGSVEAHVVPSLNLGISALSVVEASVFLNLDASAKMTLEVDAAAVPLLYRRASETRMTTSSCSPSAIRKTRTSPTSGLPRSISSRQAAVATAAKASVGGSFVISAGLDVNAGATGTFFGLFDATTKVSLFQKTFNLLTVRELSFVLSAL